MIKIFEKTALDVAAKLLEIEAIKREKDESKLKVLGLDLANLKEERNEIFAKWKSEKDIVDSIQFTKTEIESDKISSPGMPSLTVRM